MNKKIFFLILLAGFLLPVAFIRAQELFEIVDTVSFNLQLLGGGLSTIAFIVAGIMFLTSTTNPERMKIAKGALLAAVIGIVILLLAPFAGSFVSTFFGLSGF